MRLLLVFLILISGPIAMAQEPKCLGQGSPQNDFYIQDLNKKVSTALSVERRFQDLTDDITGVDLKISQLQKELFKSPSNSENIKKQLQILEKEKLKNIFQIAKVARDKEKYQFILAWYNDEGKKYYNTEANFCINGECSNQATLAKLTEAETFTDVPHLDKQCVEKSLTAKLVFNDEALCSTADSVGTLTHGQCVNQNLANYIHWAFNKAIDCLSDANDPINPDTLWSKVNNESGFRFFFSWSGGRGIMQTIPCSQDEMLGLSPSEYCGHGGHGKYRSMGRKFLVRMLHEHNKLMNRCDLYKPIIDFDKEFALDEQSDHLGDLNTASRIFNSGKKGFSDENKKFLGMIKNRYEDKISELKSKNPQVAKLIEQINMLKVYFGSQSVKEKLSQKDLENVKKTIESYQQKLDQYENKSSENKDFIDEYENYKNSVNAFSNALKNNSVSNGDKTNLSNLIKREQQNFNDLRSDYPLYNQRLFNPRQQNACQFISLEQGIHRNILTGIALFLYYRNGYYNGQQQDDSAQWVLKNAFHITPSQSENYREIRDKVTLAMYGPDGNNGAATKLQQNKWQFKNPKKMEPETFSAKLQKIFDYLKATNRSKIAVVDHFKEEDIQCSVK